MEGARADRPFLAVLLMVGFCALAPLGDAFAKLIGDAVPLGQLIALRFAVQAAVLVPVVLLTRRSLRMTRRVLGLTALRTGLHVVALGALFLALRFLPLADALAICYVMPFVLLLLGRLVLGEEVGPRRLIGCGVGFVGTLMVVQPSFAAVGAPALLPLLVAGLFAVFMLVTRQIARDADPVALQALSGVVAAGVLLPLVALSAGRGWRELDWVVPDAGVSGLVLMVGLLGTAAHLLITWALRFAPAATLAPVQYLEIPFATLIGLVLFRDLPNGLAAGGIVVVTGSGLYVIHRERRATHLPSAGEV